MDPIEPGDPPTVHDLAPTRSPPRGLGGGLRELDRDLILPGLDVHRGLVHGQVRVLGDRRALDDDRVLAGQRLDRVRAVLPDRRRARPDRPLMLDGSKVITPWVTGLPLAVTVPWTVASSIDESTGGAPLPHPQPTNRAAARPTIRHFVLIMTHLFLMTARRPEAPGRAGR